MGMFLWLLQWLCYGFTRGVFGQLLRVLREALSRMAQQHTRTQGSVGTSPEKQTLPAPPAAAELVTAAAVAQFRWCQRA